MSHPENHEFPEPIRVWPEGDVFFVFCPVVFSDWKLLPNRDYIRKYRILVYDGELSADKIDQYWQAFAKPPNVVIE